MPKLRRLSGLDVIRILERHFGFAVIRVRGSHHILRRTVVVKTDGEAKEEVQTVNIPVHGSTPLGLGLLKRLHRDLQRYISDEDLKKHFYTD